MKKFIGLTCSLFFTISLFAQTLEDTSQTNTPIAQETHSYFGAGVGYYFLPMANVNAHFADLGVSIANTTQMIGVGIDRGYNTVTSKFSHGVTGLMSFHYLLPQKFNGVGDSVKVSFNGYNAQFDLLGANFVKSEIITLTGGLGWAFGRVKVTEETNAGKTVFLNKYFAPEGRFEFNVRFAEHFFIGLRYAYRADITKSRWTKSGVNSPDLPGTNMSGTMIGAFIGYGK
ncbi:hypothetical protein BH09BAC5_BH09BAC5_00590 [soil metagenome]